MQFEYMEVEATGANGRQAVGPLSSGLNAVVIPRGVGKNRLRYWLRQGLLENTHGEDGYQGRPVSGWRVNGSYSRPVSARQTLAVELLSSIDEVIDQASALDDVASRLGLELSEDSKSGYSRDALVARERELIERLDRVQSVTSVTREELLGRRRDVEHQLAQLRSRVGYHGNFGVNADFNRRADRFSAIEVDLRGALAEIDQCERDLAEVKAQLKVDEIGRQTVQVEQSYRQQLQQLDDRLNRWRQTLRDLRLHRENIEHDETDAVLDDQVGTQLSGTLHPDSRSPIRSLEAQLHNARKQLDQLVVQYGQSAVYGYAGAGSYRVEQNGYHLPETLRSMQKDLHEICHHLSRYEAHSAAKALKTQAQQLRRCESELLQSVEKLIEERGQLLRKIADKYHLTSDQLSLAFGDWCQCNDHPHLADWLLKEETSGGSAPLTDGSTVMHDRAALLDRIARLEAQRKEASLRAEECRRQLREIDPSRLTVGVQPVVVQSQSEEVELLRELDVLTVSLNDLDNRDRLRVELDDLRRQLSAIPATPVQTSGYRQAVNRHVAGLNRAFCVPGGGSSALNGYSPVSSSSVRYYDNVLSSVIVHVAQRLAIAEVLASRGDVIPVVLDRTLDGLNADLQRAIIEYLSRSQVTHAAVRQQVVLMTDDQQVVDWVRHLRGAVHVLRASQSYDLPKDDINQLLAAYANDEESAKWYRPSVGDWLPKGERRFYLTDESWIEKLPFVSQAVTARFRAVGIDRVGDLLDADAERLARALRLERVTDVTIRKWQSVARLLCTVPGLRPFDARILVGAGVQSARELSTKRPGELLARVERFLDTDTGRRILRSGTSEELTRITNWLAAANGRATRIYREERAIEDEARRLVRKRTRRSRRRFAEETGSTREYPTVNRKTHRVNGTPVKALRFFLDLSSLVGDAPSIGDRLVGHLNKHGIVTVEQLLAANAETLAKKLNQRRIDADKVRQWQDQARLVCRIPNLRGHDAQLLVACKITTPELLASLNPENVLNQVLAFSRSAAGVKVLRGSPEPDLAEVTNWISWANQSRALNAA